MLGNLSLIFFSTRLTYFSKCLINVLYDIFSYFMWGTTFVSSQDSNGLRFSQMYLINTWIFTVFFFHRATPTGLGSSFGCTSLHSKLSSFLKWQSQTWEARFEYSIPFCWRLFPKLHIQTLRSSLFLVEGRPWTCFPVTFVNLEEQFDGFDWYELVISIDNGIVEGPRCLWRRVEGGRDSWNKTYGNVQCNGAAVHANAWDEDESQAASQKKCLPKILVENIFWPAAGDSFSFHLKIRSVLSSVFGTQTHFIRHYAGKKYVVRNDVGLEPKTLGPKPTS